MYFLSLRKDDSSYFNVAAKTQTRLIGPLTLSESFDVMDAIKKQIVEDIKLTNNLTDEELIEIEVNKNAINFEDDEWLMITVSYGDDYWYIIRTEVEKYSRIVIHDFLN